MRYLPVIDGLRFLAIMPVVLQHLSERVLRLTVSKGLDTQFDHFLSGLLPSGRFGVELFFIISGLIISYPFISAHFSGRERPNLRAFYLRRLTRLEPPYILTMLVCFFFLVLSDHQAQLTNTYSQSSVGLTQSILASLFYIHGFVFGEYPRLNPLAWSLEIEVQFYLSAPLLLMLILRLSRQRRILLALIVFAGISLFSSLMLSHSVGEYHRFFLTKFLHLFLLGMVINVLTITESIPRDWPAWVWDLAWIISFGTLYAIYERTGGQGRLPSLPLLELLKAAAFFVLFLGTMYGRFFNRFFSLPWITAIGGMCYTIYLIHLPFLQIVVGPLMKTTGLLGYLPGLFVSIIFAGSVLFVLSVAFYLLIEKPCMDPGWPKKFWQRLTMSRAGSDLQP